MYADPGTVRWSIRPTAMVASGADYLAAEGLLQDARCCPVEMRRGAPYRTSTG
jgi:hypothetical protein